MNQLILITAMSATTGLFGGGKHCGGKVHLGRAGFCGSHAAYSAPAPCGWSPAYGTTQASAPASYPGAPRMAPAMPPAPVSAPAAPPASAPATPPVPAPPPMTSANYAPAGRTYVYRSPYGPTSTPYAGYPAR